MKATLLPALLLFAGGLVSAADDVIKELRLSGMMTNRIYHNVRIVRTEPDGLRITHDSGFAKVPYEALPQDMRDKFDPSVASRFRNDLEERERVSQTAAEVVDRQEQMRARREAAPVSSTLKLVTSQDVKVRWLEKVAPSDWALRRSINAGAYDKLALLHAHDYNTRALTKWGAYEESTREREVADALRKEVRDNPLLADARSQGLYDPYAGIDPPAPTGEVPAPPTAAPVAAPVMVQTPMISSFVEVPSYDERGELKTNAAYGYSSPYYRNRWSQSHPYSSDAVRILGVPSSSCSNGGSSISSVNGTSSVSTWRSVPTRSNYIYIYPSSGYTTGYSNVSPAPWVGFGP